MAEPPVDLLKAIAHPLRYAILKSLAGCERNVGEIEADTGIGQPTLSQQLSVLRSAGLVTSRREAKLVYYSNESSVLAEARRALDALIVDRPDKRREPRKARNGLTGAAMFARMD